MMINRVQFNNSASGGSFKMWLRTKKKTVRYFFSSINKKRIIHYKLLINAFGIEKNSEKVFVAHQFQMAEVSAYPMLKLQLKNKATAL